MQSSSNRAISTTDFDMTTPKEHTTTSISDLDKLGKERPHAFSGLWPELAFCFSIVMSQILAEFYISGSNVLLLTLVKELDVPAASTIWLTAAISLAITSTLLIFGRLIDMYGGYVIYNAGAIWLIISSILCGVSQTWLMLVVCRALQGLALGALLPSGMMILGSAYRPGPRKNLVFSIYGACATLGFFAGFFVAGICGQYLTWRWYFFIGTILSVMMASSSLFYIPRDYAEKRELGIRMDWCGFCLSISGATLFVFAIADSSYARRVGELRIFRMSAFMGATSLQIVAWTVPMAVGGLILSVTGGFILHKVSGTVLMIISCLGYVGSGLLFTIIPLGGNYWAFVFPAMICGTIAIDISFNLANIFITTSVPKAKQGLAGALIYCTMHMGIAVMLGLADIVETQTKWLDKWKSYKAVFGLQTGLCVLGLLIVLGFVRIRHAKSELTADEKEQLERGNLTTGHPETI
ncbi:hypothetical protein N7448_011390 [Penicillium atrosanguineum]|nr:hypothetical protein N7448_011390 [Penicillium atrosanguineum]